MSFLWKLGGAVSIIAIILAVVFFYGNAKYKQGKAASDSAWSKVVIQGEKDKLAEYQKGVASVARAENTYHETVRDRLIPVTKTIVERSTEYAHTPEGAVVCLTGDRVRLLNDARSALFPAAPTVAPAERPSTVSPHG